ncbi:MAG: hypothetical protein ABSG86_04380 [Thermoguttaceae bacterium]|jgi:hypothetical protein
MKRLLLSVAAAIAVALLAANLPAQAGDTSKTKGDTSIKMVTPDWHYRWHDGRWWYWMSENHENRWMVWTGSAWTPYEQLANSRNVLNVSEARPDPAGNPADAIPGASTTLQPVYSGGGYCPPARSAGSGGNYAGYGWTWGPGTAFRNSPGQRF